MTFLFPKIQLFANAAETTWNIASFSILWDSVTEKEKKMPHQWGIFPLSIFVESAFYKMRFGFFYLQFFQLLIVVGAHSNRSHLLAICNYGSSAAECPILSSILDCDQLISLFFEVSAAACYQILFDLVETVRIQLYLFSYNISVQLFSDSMWDAFSHDGCTPRFHT